MRAALAALLAALILTPLASAGVTTPFLGAGRWPVLGAHRRGWSAGEPRKRLAGTQALEVSTQDRPPPGAAPADQPDELTPGATLEALSDVTVAGAALAKGARVTVVRVVERQRRVASVDSVDVELADGHVARAPIATLRASFRIVTD